MPKHIAILLLLLGGFLILALIAKSCMTDPSFYRFGDYRADAVPEIAAGTPLFKGAEYCQTCHKDGFAYGSGGAHGSVQCEICHGPDPGHPDNTQMSVPASTIEICTLCHEALPARPAQHPQIVVADHPSPDEAGEQCHSCHDPHSPGDGGSIAGVAGADSETADSSATLLAAVPGCAKCHGDFGEGRRKNPAIAGLETNTFIDLINMYASGSREHKAMNRYASELSAEEILELARYYEQLAPETPD